MSTSQFDPIKQTTSTGDTSNQLDQLKSKIEGFAVFDSHGDLLGEVRDVRFNAARQLDLVIAQPDAHRGFRLLALNGKFVQRVDSAARSLFTNASTAEMEQLSEYEMEFPLSREGSESSSNAETLKHGLSSLLTQNPDHFDTPMPAPEPSDRLQPPLYDTTLEPSVAPKAMEEEVVRLLEERLVVDRGKRKVGEVIVRKEIETRMVEIPIRREKLIVEQVGSEHKRLAEIDLGQGEVTGVDLAGLSGINDESTAHGEFTSLKTASQVLDAIASQPNHGCKRVHIQIVLEDPSLRETYQNWLNHYSSNH